MIFILFLFFLLPSGHSQINLSFEDLKSKDFLFLKSTRTHLVLTYDYLANAGGEDSRPKNIGAFELFVKNKTQKGRSSFHFGHLERFGNENVIGDAQTASNIDVATNADRIIDLWYDHDWTKNTSTLVGIHDLSTEFNVTHTSLNFLNSSFGTGAEISYSGNNGPSLYPFTSAAFRLYQRWDRFSWRAAIYDGDPGGKKTYQSFHSDVGGKDGFFVIQEGAHQANGRKNAVGIWNHTTINSRGLYYLFETKLSDSGRAFVRYGWSDPTKSRVTSNTALGGTYRGILQGKNHLDEAGLGLTQLRFSNDELRSEVCFETYYQFQLTKEILLRPDSQFITAPSGSRKIKNAWVYALRTVVLI